MEADIGAPVAAAAGRDVDAEIEGAVRGKLEFIASDNGFLLFCNEENLHLAVTPLGSHPLEYLVRGGDIHEIDAGINGNGDDEIGAHEISRFRFV